MRFFCISIYCVYVVSLHTESTDSVILPGMAWSKASGFERLKPRPSHKSGRARVNYTLLVLLILIAQSTDLLCSEALGRKRGVATDTQGPKTAAQSPGSQNSSTEPVCA